MKSTNPRTRAEAMASITASQERKPLDKSKNIREEYAKNNPEDPEGVELMSKIVDFFNNEKRFQKEREMPKKMDLLKKMTEFTAAWTQYVHEHSSDRKHLEMYWRQLEYVARAEDSERTYAMSRSGVRTQVATMKIFEALGLNPHLSQPHEDAYQKIDMWVEDQTAVQIKTESGGNDVEIVETDTATPLHIEVSAHGESARVSALGEEEISKFRIKLNSYANAIGKESLRGIFIVIPKRQIDPITGEPSVQLVKSVERKLRALGHMLDTVPSGNI